MNAEPFLHIRIFPESTINIILKGESPGPAAVRGFQYSLRGVLLFFDQLAAEH